jgi:hypothetical protein
MTMDDSRKPASDWRLERLAQGELDDAAARALERDLGADETRRRLDEIAASNQEILARLPPDQVGVAIRRRLAEAKQGRPVRGRLMMALVPLVAAAGLFGFASISRQAAVTGPAEEIILVKGSTRLLAYRAESGTRATRLAEAARVRPHDSIQLSYVAGEARYGMILSLDGRGVVTQHWPLHPAASAELIKAGEVRLPRSYELDEAPSAFERFFFVTAMGPFSQTDVLDAARTLARTPAEARRKALVLPSSLMQQSLLLEKVQP